jgi:hypothetical protein
MKDKIKRALGIVDGILALVCVVMAARAVEPKFPAVQFGLELVGFLAVFAAVAFCFASGQN